MGRSKGERWLSRSHARQPVFRLDGCVVFVEMIGIQTMCMQRGIGGLTFANHPAQQLHLLDKLGHRLCDRRDQVRVGGEHREGIVAQIGK